MLHIKHRIYSRQSISIRVDKFKTSCNRPLPLEFTVEDMPQRFRITYCEWLTYPVEPSLSRRDNITYRQIPMVDLNKYVIGERKEINKQMSFVRGFMKYKLRLDLKIEVGINLYRIERISTGELGGWIEKESNLDQYGNAWISGDAKVYGDTKVSGNAWVSKLTHIINLIFTQSFSVTITPQNIAIGCELKTLSEWKKMTQKIAIKRGLTKKQFQVYRKIILEAVKLIEK